MMLYIGFVAGLNCDSTSFSTQVPFCSNGKSMGRNVYLSGVDNRTNGIGCNCSISLATDNEDPVKIEIRNVTTTSNVCDYSLYSVYRNNTTRLYTCDEHLQLHKDSFDLEPMETLSLYMEKGTVNGAGFLFCLNMVTDKENTNIILECTSKSTTTTASPTPVTHIKSTSANHSMSSIANTNNIPTSSTFRNGDTSATYSTPLNPGTGGDNGTSYTTVKSNTSSVIPSTTEQQPNNDDSERLIGTVIGSIVGVLVVVALVMVVICLVKRRQKKHQYETPLEPQDRPHNYLNAVVTPNNNANGYNSQITNPGNQGMTYLENDLYKSIDDDESVERRGGNHEGMIYLENDLYISSNGTDDVNQDAENSVPHQPVEYAVVNKTAKKSSSSDGASTGHTVGPRGDEYTLVQEK
ncbi:hypothetical protein SNE40_013662 [Patella caerulea]|uniref:Uncharacterized protein n=1 Tax=Patella caerulea TaxID=87958 RepID=A0AAN8PR05_PATCE